MKLLHGDIVAVHEEVQQVDAQVSGCRTQPEVVADDGYEVCKVSPQVELGGLAFVGWQLKFLLDNKTRPSLHLLCMRIQRAEHSHTGARVMSWVCAGEQQDSSAGLTEIMTSLNSFVHQTEKKSFVSLFT